VTDGGALQIIRASYDPLLAGAAPGALQIICAVMIHLGGREFFEPANFAGECMGIPVRTDFMSIEEFKRRALEAIRRGDQHDPAKVMQLDVPFDAAFDAFAHNVAHALRHEIVYRSDGGRFARGFVRASGDLEKLHRLYRQAGVASGSSIGLTAAFYRRRHPDPKMRWAISVQFIPRTTKVDVDGEITNARPEVMAELAYKVLDAAGMILDSSAWNPPNGWGHDRVLRMKDWLHIARELGYPAFLNLWYYNREPAWWYVRWNTTAPERQHMTAATGGKLPFDGNAGAQHGEWRLYPFRAMMSRCRGRDRMDDCANMVAEEMRRAEENIFESIADLNREINRANSVNLGTVGDPHSLLHPFSSSAGTSADALGPEASVFVKSFKDLLKDPHFLYSPYLRYAQTATPDE
jgi:hypothetical protein